MIRICLFGFFILLNVISSHSLYAQAAPTESAPADPKATKRTRALFQNLKAIQGSRVLFGHQDDLAYGVGWRRQAGRSDVKDVCGAYPAVFGWELGRKFGPDQRQNIDSVDYSDARTWIRQAYKMGGVNTISWHLDNLKTGQTAWDTTATVRDLLPGGYLHEAFRNQLSQLADYLNSLDAGFLFFRHKIPVIFRPWHEHTGNWFWWGAGSCTPEEYKQLWRFTVRYLREERGLHHLLFAYSPDVFKDEAHYMLNYPGDEYVDLFGLDYYYRKDNLEKIKTDLPEKLHILTTLAAQHGKIAALTETGLESIPMDDWWTGMLLRQLQDGARDGHGVSYVLVWRNARLSHHFGPFPGQRSARDFAAFSKDKFILMADRLPKLYKKI